MQSIAGMRLLVVAAHPDDETIGASTILNGPHEVSVIHVTDGAPHDPRWWPDGVTSRAAYARRRLRELHDALALAVVVPVRAIELGIVDQEVWRVLPELVEALTAQFEQLAPEIVVTHAYEGGHPDHDSVALAVALARARVRPTPVVIEMALYHGATGSLTAGRFASGPPGWRHLLEGEELGRRLAMLACFTSQRATLAPFFELAHEAFRRAPRYDFAVAPHDGALHYERIGMTPTAAEWRAQILASVSGA
jgi:LmbE family N-acetylglucosaminyl deacetylase